MDKTDKRGGYRAGAGRKPLRRETSKNPKLRTNDPIEFLRALMRDSRVSIKLRQDSAKKLLSLEQRLEPKEHKVEGKKAAAKTRAATAVNGRFGPGRPPSSVVTFRRKGGGEAA